MRLLVHNLLMCNVSKCDKNNYPLIIQVNKSIIIQVEYKREAILKIMPKLEFNALSNTVRSLGNNAFPTELPVDYQQNEPFLQEMHRILFETHIVEGQLICPNPQCGRAYPIVNGIPNMILNEDEI